MEETGVEESIGHRTGGLVVEEGGEREGGWEHEYHHLVLEEVRHRRPPSPWTAASRLLSLSLPALQRGSISLFLNSTTQGVRRRRTGAPAAGRRVRRARAVAGEWGRTAVLSLSLPPSFSVFFSIATQIRSQRNLPRLQNLCLNKKIYCLLALIFIIYTWWSTSDVEYMTLIIRI